MSIHTITRHAARVASGKDPKVRPGVPAAFTAAAAPGDFGWQGDLKLTIVEKVPDGYVHVKAPTEADKQLVPGTTQGARHCLDSLQGVTLYRPKEWGVGGPCLVLALDRRILHPTHGTVTVPAGTVVLCSYQREWDKQQQAARRSVD